MRLPLEVFRRCAKPCRMISWWAPKFLASEAIDGGSPLEDVCHFATAFAKAGMDFLSLSRGGKFDDAKQPKVGAAAYPYTGPSGYECMPQYISDEQGPFGRNFAATRAIRRGRAEAGFETPVVAAGGIHNFEVAEGLSDGTA